MSKKIAQIYKENEINALVRQYKNLEKYVRNQLFSVISYTPERVRRIKKNIFDKIEKQDAYNLAWGKKNIYVAYNESSERNRKELIKLHPATENKEPRKGSFKKHSGNSKKHALGDFMFFMSRANLEYKKKINLFFRLMKKSRQVLEIQNLADRWTPEITERIKEIKAWSLKRFPRTTKSGFEYLASPSLREINKEVAKVFAEAFGDFDFITVPTKSGGFRNYSPDKYIKMVARTETRFTQSRAVLDRCAQFDNDLVAITSHAGACRICVPFEGQIYSISGKNKDYPELDSEPPFHPHCGHSMYPTSIEKIQLDAQDPNIPPPPEPRFNYNVADRLKELKAA